MLVQNWCGLKPKLRFRLMLLRCRLKLLKCRLKCRLELKYGRLEPSSHINRHSDRALKWARQRVLC